MTVSNQAIERTSKQLLAQGYFDKSPWLWSNHEMPPRWSVSIKGLPQKRCNRCGQYVQVGKRGEVTGTLTRRCYVAPVLSGRESK